LSGYSNSEYLQLKVTPNAARTAITGYGNGYLQVKLAAPPVKGKANRELIDFLSRTLGVKRSTITIVKGMTGRNKVINVEGLTRQEIIDRILR
jgi:uncharacterized protein (TIGR00251 family)